MNVKVILVFSSEIDRDITSSDYDNQFDPISLFVASRERMSSSYKSEKENCDLQSGFYWRMKSFDKLPRRSNFAKGHLCW